MSHSHAGHAHGGSTGNLKVAFFLNLGFTVVELIGGLWTNSIAITTDALHDLGDSASLGLSWYFDHLSRRGRTAEHTFGYRRYRLLGGLITSLTLIAGLSFVLWQAIERLASPQPVHAPGMIGLAVIGILVNGAAAWRTQRGSSLTEKLVSWHLLEDTLGWVAVLIGAGVMTLWDLPIIDPLLSVILAVFILWNVVRNLRQVMHVFLQRAPASFDLTQFEREVAGVPKVVSTHHAHVWSLDGETHVLSLHIVMQRDASRADIVAAKEKVRASLDPKAFLHVTIDVELEGEACAAAAEPTRG